MGINTNAVQRLYVAYFNRPGEPVGMAHWEAQLPATAATQAQLAAIAASFSGSAEYIALYAGQSNTSIVNNLYLNLFGRAAESAGLISWAGKLTAGTETFASIALQLTYSAQGTDATAIANKLTAANSFTTALDTAAEIVGYSGTAAATSGRTYLAAVTDVAATLTTSASGLTASVAAAVAAGTTSGGTTFTLTTGVDQGTNFTGTSNADTFVASVDAAGAATNTLNVTDVLVGGNGTDTLSLTASVTNATALQGASISGIEIINIRSFTAGQTATVDASTAVGATEVNSKLSAGLVTVTSMAATTAAGVIGNSTVANGVTSFTWVNAATASTLNIADGVTAGAVTLVGAGVLATTVNSTGANNVLGSLTMAASSTALTINAATGLTTGAITSAGLTAITASGATTTNVDMSGGLAASTVTVNASGLTAAGVTATLIAGITSFVGGAGNDDITTATLTATVAGQINAGSGTADRLVVAAAANVNSTTKAAEFTGFEILRAGAFSLDASTIAGITSVQSGGAGSSFTGLSAAQAAALTIYGTSTGATFALTTATGTADVLSMTLANDLAANVATVISLTGAGMTITGFETLNVAVNSGISTAITATAATGADQIAFAAAADLKTLTVTGAFDVGINLANALALTTLNVSALTGSTAGAGITMASGTAALTVTGSNNIDFVTLATLGVNGSVTLNTGSGNDTVTGTIAQVAAQTINGGTGTTDSLIFSDNPAGTINDNTFANVTGFEKLSLTSNLGAVNLTSGGFFNTAFATGVTITGGTVAAGSVAAIDLSTYTQAANATLVSSSINTGAAIILKGGSGADTLVGTFAGYTGVAGGLVISGGAGVDTISWTDVSTGIVGASVITGGAGGDIITHTSTGAASAHARVTYLTTGSSDSLVASYDQITGFVLGAGGATNSDLLDLTGTATLAGTATAAASGITNITYTVSAVGLLTFGGTAAASMTQAQMQTVAALATAVDGTEVVFVNGANSWVYHHDVTNGDQMVQLVGTTALGLAVATTNVAGLVFAV